MSVWSVMATKIFWPDAAFQSMVEVKSASAPVCAMTEAPGVAASVGLAVWGAACEPEAVGGATLGAATDGLADGWDEEHAAITTARVAAQTLRLPIAIECLLRASAARPPTVQQVDIQSIASGTPARETGGRSAASGPASRLEPIDPHDLRGAGLTESAAVRARSRPATLRGSVGPGRRAGSRRPRS